MLRENVTYKYGGIWEVRCRGCGTPIRAQVPDDTNRETKIINGKPVVFERLVLACLSNYREVLMDCGGGPGDNYIASGHVACVCASCAEKYTPAQLQEHHDLDMAEMQLHKEGRGVNGVAKVALHISST